MSFNYLNQIWEKSNHSIKIKHNYRMLFPYYQGRDQAQHIKVDYSSNDYLSLKNDRRIIEEGYQSALYAGAGSGSSRMVTQTDPCLELLETEFSFKTGYAHSFFFPSGFIANISLYDALSPFPWEEGSFQQQIFIDHRCHSSLFYGLKNSNIKHDQFRHLDYEHLIFKLKSSHSPAKIIVIESLYSMDGDYSDPYKLLEVCQEFGAMLVVDETHSIGAFGKKACWISEFPFLKPFVLASVFGCGKAIGVSGGFISTDHFQLKERILQKSRPLIYSTAVSPFITGAVKKSLEIIFSNEGDKKRDSLQENIKYLKKGLLSIKASKREFLFHENQIENHSSNIFPLIYSDCLNIIEKEKFFIKQGLLLKAIRPPSVPRGTSRFRVILRSGHSKGDIDFLLNHVS